MVHPSSGTADGNTVFADGEIIFVSLLNTTLFIEINEGLDAMLFAVNIVRHGIVSRIEKQFLNMKIRQKVFHSKERMKKTMGIMHGSRIEQRKDRKIAFRIGGNHHV